MLKDIFNQIRKHVYTIFGDLFVSCSNTCYVMYEDIFTKKFKHVYTMFDSDIVWGRVHTMLVRNAYTKLFDICYKFFKSFSSKFVQNGVYCWKWMKILKSFV